MRPTLISTALALLALSNPAQAPLAQEREAPATLDSFQRDAEDRMLEVREALDVRLEELATVARDYAHWDDAWRFATGERRLFPAAGLLPPALSRLDIHYMLVQDRRFRTRLTLAITGPPPRESIVPADAMLAGALRRAAEADALNERGQSLRGLARVGGVLSLVVVRPVLRERAAGPPGGWLAFAQTFSDESLQSALQTSAPQSQGFAIGAIPAELPVEVRDWLETPSDTPVFSQLGEETLTTWLALRDLDGRAVWVARRDTPVPEALRPRPVPPAVLEPVAVSEESPSSGWAGAILLLIIAALALWGWQRRNAGPKRLLTRLASVLPRLPQLPRVQVRRRAQMKPAAEPELPAAPALAAEPEPLAAPAPQAPPDAPAPVELLPSAEEILLGAPEGVVLAAMDNGRVLRANPAAQALFGLCEADLKARSILGLLRAPSGMAGAPGTVLRLDQPTRHLNQVLVDARGLLHSIEISVTPLPSGAGRTAALFLHEAGPDAEPAPTSVAPEQLALCYQPVVDIAAERVCALEALPRWKDAALGWIRPDDPLTIAGEGDSRLTVGRFVLETVARDIQRWHEQGVVLVPVSINFATSGLDLEDARVGLRHAVSGLGIEPSLLKAELGADLLLDRRTGGFRADTLEQWRELGLKMVVDRMVARSSALTIPVLEGLDTLKLDISLVRDISSDLAARRAVMAILAQARSRGMIVVAEGVDRWQQLEALRELGCQHAQGPLFTQPVPFEEVAGFLRDERFETLVRVDLSDTDELPALKLS